MSWANPSNDLALDSDSSRRCCASLTTLPYSTGSTPTFKVWTRSSWKWRDCSWDALGDCEPDGPAGLALRFLLWPFGIFRMMDEILGFATAKFLLGVDEALRLPLCWWPGMACTSTDSEEIFNDEEMFSDIWCWLDEIEIEWVIEHCGLKIDATQCPEINQQHSRFFTLAALSSQTKGLQQKSTDYRSSLKRNPQNNVKGCKSYSTNSMRQELFDRLLVLTNVPLGSATPPLFSLSLDVKRQSTKFPNLLAHLQIVVKQHCSRDVLATVESLKHRCFSAWSTPGFSHKNVIHRQSIHLSSPKKELKIGFRPFNVRKDDDCIRLPAQICNLSVGVTHRPGQFTSISISTIGLVFWCSKSISYLVPVKGNDLPWNLRDRWQLQLNQSVPLVKFPALYTSKIWGVNWNWRTFGWPFWWGSSWTLRLKFRNWLSNVRIDHSAWRWWGCDLWPWDQTSDFRGWSW